MNDLAKVNDRSAQLWIETILSERFGLPLQLALIDRQTWRISLQGNERCIQVDADPTFFTCTDSNLAYSEWDAAREGWLPILGGSLPAPGLAEPATPLIEVAQGGYVIHYDILGLTYWMLTRLEEVGRTDLDEHGRFPATASHALQHGYLERPAVDEWMDILGQVIQRTWSGAEPRPHQFSIKVSHDVDRASRYGFRPWHSVPFGIASDLLRNHDVRGLIAPWIRLRTRNCLHPWDAFNTFDWLMDVSERNGVTSAFYFICDRRGTAHDSEYDLNHAAIRTLIRRIHARGHEIGLHPSYATFLEPAQIRREADRLWHVCAEEGVNQEHWGGRMHYLQWRQPTTMRAWDAAGMAYDSTLTYANHAGFRCGTCFEYPAFDPVAGEALALRIRPLVVMEGTVIGQQYMNLGVTAAARRKMLELKETCRALDGCFTLLWHNSSLQTKAEKELYETVVAA